MAVLGSIEEWQRQSSLLLQARPTTTRITTKYNIPNLNSAKYQKSRKRKVGVAIEDHEDAAAAPKVPKAVLTLKTYDPESGVCLKFKTDRAADVGRLINGLGRLSRHMAALPQKTEDVVMQDRPASSAGPVADTSNATEDHGQTADKAQQNTAATGKKKKKGKK